MKMKEARDKGVSAVIVGAGAAVGVVAIIYAIPYVTGWFVGLFS